jgi:nitrogen regulatory protein PII
MVATHPKKKIEIVIDAIAVPDVIAIVRKSGAKGHTVIPNATGSGPRGKRGRHDIFQEGENAVILVIADETVVLAILESVMTLLESYAGVAFVSDVQVARADHF